MTKRARALLIGIIAIAILGPMVLATVVRMFLIEAFKVPTGSMIPTLLPGDHLFANKLARAKKPARGDVIVFKFPMKEDQDFVFRVVGLPGDRIELRDGRFLINNVEIPRCHVGRVAIEGGDAELFVETLDGRKHLALYQLDSTESEQGSWLVRDNEVFVLGDNRDNSYDSRRWWDGKGGGVPIENVRGRVWMLWHNSEQPGRVGLNVSAPPTLPASMQALAPHLEKCLTSE